jgi:hypothetical protein
MGRVAQTPLAAVGLLTPAPRSAATTAHRQKSKINSATGHLRPPLITRGGEENWRRGKRYCNVPGLLRNLPVSTAEKYSNRPGSERTRAHVPGL